MKFLCGASREKITPPIGTGLYGYSPDVISTEVHDDLTLSAIAFGDGEKTLILISVDLAELNTDLTTEMRAACAEACGVSLSDVIITTTHNHCAPNLSGMSGWGDIDREYYALFLPALLRAAKAAVAGMTEAEMGVAVGRSDVGINRREYLLNGDTILGQNPWGQYDASMTVLRIRRKDDRKGIVNLIHYGCHGTACGCSTIITRDWPGVMIDRMEKVTGELTVFVNGAIGDVGPRLTNGSTTGDITHVEELGAVAAMDAVRISGSVTTYNTPSLQKCFGTVRLPLVYPQPLEEVRREREAMGDPAGLVNCEGLHYQHLCDLENWYVSENREAVPSHLTFDMTAIAVGDVLLLPYPYEIFSETSIRLRAHSGYGHTLCLSCANGYNGYLPSQDQLCRGGYEVAVFRYANLFPLSPDTDNHLIEESLRILKESKN